MEKTKHDGGFVPIVSVCGGIMFVILLMLLIFDRDHADLAVPLSWSLVVLGIAASYFQYRAKSR